MHNITTSFSSGLITELFLLLNITYYKTFTGQPIMAAFISTAIYEPIKGSRSAPFFPNLNTVPSLI